ncbi:hypothetical protein [Acinetobacter gerneri]|uniref:hypothetical protein n=1 Tax=Acinetobacter gerneri TaxID=202952 RepID=UPI003A85D680
MNTSPLKSKSTFSRYGLWVILLIVLIVVVGVLFNQQQQRQADLELAKLALEQSKINSPSAQATSTPATTELSGIEGMGMDGQIPSQTSTQIEDPEIAASAESAVAAVQAAKQSIKLKLSQQIDAEYHDTQNLNSSLSHYGLKPMSSAPADLKGIVNSIDQMLTTHLMEVWGRASADQVAKQLEGWSVQGNVLTYRTAWDSDRSQCTWYVVSWDKNNHQVLDEGYMPCFK